MASSTSPPSIAIIGSGIGGLGLAIGLLKQNVAVTICKLLLSITGPNWDVT